MNVTLFTSNSPRHLALAEKLAMIAEAVYMVQECTTCFQGAWTTTTADRL
jgi:hypothetical protein